MSRKRSGRIDDHKDVVLAALETGESAASVARRLGFHPTTIHYALRRWEVEAEDLRRSSGEPDEIDLDRLAAVISRAKETTVEELADALDVPPKKIRPALDALRADGYRINDPEEHQIRLEKIAPTTEDRITRSLLEGEEVTVAIVSDTHLGSREQALDALEAFYDEVEAREISEVWHAGDLVAGVDIYRGQIQSGIIPGLHTYREQVEYAVENYPKRDGVHTMIIAGNHDVEGAAGRIGADPVAAVCHRRSDMTYLGTYTGTIELPNGAYAQMVHGRGGGSYAVSYKPQKYVESLAPGRKPALLIFGHWHVSGWFRHRYVNCLLAGCFEWQTDLLVRLGLQPDVGGWVVKMRLADDGSIVGIRPEWLSFYPGRVEVAA